MLLHSFRHIPGIGAKTEQQIWDWGFNTWEDALSGTGQVTAKQRQRLEQYARESKAHLTAENPGYFAEKLPSAEHWRLFPEFRDTIVYLDIETTGLDTWNTEITTIATYDGDTVKTYVNGRNLDDFKKDIQSYKVIVTYNGKTFDVPCIESVLGITVNHVHIDLRYVLKSLGYSGGLKNCEKALGLHRGDLDGVDGYFAVLLWKEFKKTRDEKILETLLAYNVEDVVNLEMLMVKAYNMKTRDTPFHGTLRLPDPVPPHLSYTPDDDVLNQIRKKYRSWLV